MKSLLFILLAGYAARSDENNYYVIEMPDDPPVPKKPFKVYWNVPTMQCAAKKIHFENLYEKYGIIQNDNDRFKGEKITILYDPGLFPALFKNETSGKFRFRNGGVPQEGDLERHLEEFRKELDTSVPDVDFDGVGIIDFESWRPVFRQNFNQLQPYKDVSIEIEWNLHWWWKETWVLAEAKSRFEEAAKKFMRETLRVAKRRRPKALWGFYGFPYCFNMAKNNKQEACAADVPEENDQISWLWSESSALYPSIYSSVSLSTSDLTSLIRGRIKEAARNARGDVILPYFWFRYRDAGFLTETDLNQALLTLYKSKATGFLIWGSSNDVNTADKCNKLLNYVKEVLGPAIAKYTKQPIRSQDEDIESTPNVTTPNPTLNDSSNITTTIPTFNVSSNITQRPLSNDSINLNTNVDLDPEYDWAPPENYSQDIKTKVQEEIHKKINRNTTNDDNRGLKNNTVLGYILHTVLTDVENASSTIDPIKYDSELHSDMMSTTLANINETSTEASHSTRSLVTKDSLLRKINNADLSEKSFLSDQTSTTTENVALKLEITSIGIGKRLTDTDKSSDSQQTLSSIIDTEITSTHNPLSQNSDKTLFDDNDDDDIFFNSDTIDNIDFEDDYTEATTVSTTNLPSDKESFSETEGYRKVTTIDTYKDNKNTNLEISDESLETDSKVYFAEIFNESPSSTTEDTILSESSSIITSTINDNTFTKTVTTGKIFSLLTPTTDKANTDEPITNNNLLIITSTSTNNYVETLDESSENLDLSKSLHLDELQVIKILLESAKDLNTDQTKNGFETTTDAIINELISSPREPEIVYDKLNVSDNSYIESQTTSKQQFSVTDDDDENDSHTKTNEEMSITSLPIDTKNITETKVQRLNSANKEFNLEKRYEIDTKLDDDISKQNYTANTSHDKDDFVSSKTEEAYDDSSVSTLNTDFTNTQNLQSNTLLGKTKSIMDTTTTFSEIETIYETNAISKETSKTEQTEETSPDDKLFTTEQVFINYY